MSEIAKLRAALRTVSLGGWVAAVWLPIWQNTPGWHVRRGPCSAWQVRQ